MTLSILVLCLVSLQRLGELALARRNTARLLARGAVEVGARHYPLIVGLHAAWLAGLWLLAWDRPADLGWLAVYVILQGLRAWTLLSLGARWTTRIISLPGEPLVRRGPYRFFAHPNYAVVVGEIAVLPLVFHMPVYAAVFSAFNAVVLWVRIRAEAGALSRSQAPETEVRPGRSARASGRSPAPPPRTG
ncbi:MAG TPA: isoprenylcysteine carboxylmethyltransferase family protein [Phenylobacterium sp.]|uniref:isoprenylcysteine carboxyl methyltransferase family protein n=1 Tax=Phenylobacterium sp. TaxID=1871053 RepID=UPI002CE7B6EB|nr:isoprenylcysteine carboxylmethyltransferase family protein [Phenylobacterium sp.]HSV03373.1 isoprenylcysteine carboxylmethyltransferase family protein [Phenylobacterium sp.]